MKGFIKSLVLLMAVALFGACSTTHGSCPAYSQHSDIQQAVVEDGAAEQVN